eukprot:XP_027320949.1 uncharacterized protein CXorf65 homolog isoform X1 [Anas platyrhynchos]
MFICINHGDNQSFLVNTDCPVLLLLSHLRNKTSSMCATSWAPPSCSSRSRPYGRGPASSCQRPAPTTCAGWSWAPPVGAEPPLSLWSPQGTAVGVTAVPAGTAQELASRTFTPLLKDPSVALIEGLRHHGQHTHRRLQRSLKAAEGRRAPATEALPAGTYSQGAGKAAARGAARPSEEQEGAPRRTPQPPGGRQQRPRQR